MKRLVVAYIVTLHLVVGGMLWKSDFLDRVNSRLGLIEQLPKPEISEYYHRILRYHERSVDSVPDDSVIFIGDSITQGLCVSAVQPNAVNFGIGSDTTTGVLMRIPAYMPALERAKCIVLAIGVNDIHYRTAADALHNYAKILDMLPQDRRVIVSAILPIGETARQALDDRLAWIHEFNSGLKQLASDRELASFMDNDAALDTDGDNRLDKSFDDGDGVHLNSAGNLAWAADMRDAIRRNETAEHIHLKD